MQLQALGYVGIRAERCLPAGKAREFRFLKGGQDSGEPCGRLGMAIARIVIDAVRMRHKQSRHGHEPV